MLHAVGERIADDANAVGLSEFKFVRRGGAHGDRAAQSNED
jgi:hypothetical protein